MEKIVDLADFKLQRRNKAILEVGIEELNRRDREIEYFLESVVKLYYEMGKPNPVPDAIITAQMILEGDIDDYLLEQCQDRDLITIPE